MKIAQLCPTLCDSMNYTVHGILQARILEWVAFPFSMGSSQPRDWTQISHIAENSLPAEPQGKPKNIGVGSLSLLQRIFPTQELNRGLLRWRQILYQLRHQGSLKNTGVVSYSFLQGIFPTQEWNPGLPSEPPGNHLKHSVKPSSK